MWLFWNCPSSALEQSLIWADDYICIYWTLTPNCVAEILPNLWAEHISDQACQENVKYIISFILTWYLNEG